MRILLFLLFFSWSACSPTSRLSFVNEGEIKKIGISSPIPFQSKGHLIFIPVTIAKKQYHFMLDTGAGINAVDSKLAEELEMSTKNFQSVSDAANQNARIARSELKSIEIGAYVFENTDAIIFDFTNFPISIPNFGGIIGQPIINKMNWKIDFTSNQLEVSDTSFSVETLEKIPFQYHKNNLPYLSITIEGKKLDALLDLGSSNQVELPDDYRVAEKIIERYPVRTDILEAYTLNQKIDIIVKEVKMSMVQLGAKTRIEEVYVSIKELDEVRLGAALFKKKILVLDTDNQWIAIGGSKTIRN